MSPALRIAAIVGGVGALAAGYFAYHRMYAGPKRDLDQQLTTVRANVARLEDELIEHERIRSGLRDLANTTLSGRTDTLEHRLRSSLGEIAAECGLASVEVSSGSPRVMKNPAGDARLSTRSLSVALRKQEDASVVTAQLRGVGGLEQVLRTLATVGAQPWAHRVVSVSLTPEGKERERYELTLGVATLLVPDLKGEKGEPPARAELDPARAAAWRGIVERDAFRNPPPPQPERPVVAKPPPQDPPKPTPPPPPPFHEWRLTGVVRSDRLGLIAMVVNVRTNELLQLQPGQEVLGAVLLEGSGERALFKVEDRTCEVLNGQTLAERRVLDQ